jgi:glucokinase
MKYAIGVDLGGTNIAVGLVDCETRRIVCKDSIKTRAPRSSAEIAADIAALCRSVCKKHGIALTDASHVGVGAPGCVKNGCVLDASNLGWHNEPLGACIEQALSLPCFVANDANAAALAEAVWGVGCGASSLVLLTLGTGVGGGIVLDGKIWEGFNGCASEPGHVIVEAEGRACTCGNRGCLEAYCSATAIIRESRRAMERCPDSIMWRLSDGLDGVTGKTAFDAAKRGDLAARAIVDSFIRYLAIGIINIVNILQPEIIAIGGGLSAQGEALLLPLQKQVEALNPGSVKCARIALATFGNDAGILGAALLDGR